MLSKNVSNLCKPLKCKSLTYSYFHKSRCVWLCCIPDAWTTLHPLKKATAFPPDVRQSVSDIRHRNGLKDFGQFSHKTPDALLLQLQLRLFVCHILSHICFIRFVYECINSLVGDIQGHGSTRSQVNGNCKKNNIVDLN